MYIAFPSLSAHLDPPPSQSRDLDPAEWQAVNPQKEKIGVPQQDQPQAADGGT